MKKSSVFVHIRSFSVIVGFCVLLVCVLWQARRVFPRKATCVGCNVIIVSLDTLSANNLPCYGYDRATAPNICAFAGEHQNFPHAYANATFTLPTHVTMFTGLYPSTHGIRTVGTQKLSESVPFLPSILKDNGYTTIFLMDKENPHMPMDTVYYRGIDTQFDEKNVSWSRALAEFEQVTSNGDKAFLFIHSYFVHPPYQAADMPRVGTGDEFDWMFMRDEDARGVTQNFIDYLIVALEHNIANAVVKDPASHEALLRELTANKGNLQKQQSIAFRYGSIVESYRRNYDPLIRLNPFDSRQMAYLKAIYDERIRKLDSGPMEDLLRFIRKPSIARNTIVIITSDHGEEFGEHGYVSHTSLYDPNMHAVFITAVPGVRNRKVTEYVQTADIAPTIVDLLGLPGSYRFDGISIVPSLSGASLPRRLLVAESLNKTTIRLGKWKLFLDTKGKTPIPIELYDTEKDPNERDNILFAHFSLAHEMLNLYIQMRGSASQSSE